MNAVVKINTRWIHYRDAHKDLSIKCCLIASLATPTFAIHKREFLPSSIVKKMVSLIEANNSILQSHTEFSAITTQIFHTVTLMQIGRMIQSATINRSVKARIL
jgi:hypothetical protein